MDVLTLVTKLEGDARDLIAEVDKADRSIRDAEESVGDVGRTADREVGGLGSKLKGPLMVVGGLISAAFSVAAITNFTKEAVGAANELQGQFREVVTLTGEQGAAADALFSQIKGDVADLSNQVGIAQDVITGGLYDAISAGVPQENAFTFLQVASEAAIGGVTDVGTAVDGLTTIMNAWGTGAGEAQAIADSMFTTVKGGKTTFEELSSSMFQVAPSAAAAGVSFQEVNAALATMTAQGVPTSVAATNLKAAFTALQRPTDDLNKVFQDAGYASAEAALAQDGLAASLGVVYDAAGGSTGRLTELLGSVEAVQSAQIIAGTGAEKMAQELANQAEAAGAAGAAFEEIDKARALERLGIMADNVKASIGAALLPAVEAIANVLTGTVLPALQPVIDRFGEWIGTMMDSGAIDGLLSALDPLLSVIGELAPIVLQVIQAFSPLHLVFTALQPILPLIVDALAQVAAALGGALQAALPGITSLVQTLAGVLSGALGSILPTITRLVTMLADVFGKALATALPALMPLLETIAGLVGELVPPVMEVVEALMSALMPILDAAIQVFQALMPVITEIVGVLVDALVPIVELVADLFAQLVPLILPLIDVILQLVEPILGLVEALMPLLEVVLGLVLDALGPLLDLFITILEPILALVEAILGVLVPVLDVVVGAIAWVVEAIVGWMGNMESARSTVWNVITAVGGFFRDLYSRWVKPQVDLVRAIIGAVVDFISGRFDALKSALSVVGDAFVSVFTGIRDTVQTAFEFVAGVIKGALNGIIGLANGAIGALNKVSVSVPSWVPGIGGKEFGIDLPNIPLLANGGDIMQGGLAIVGDAGPEVLQLPQGARVTPLDRATAGRGDINIEINADGVIEPEEAARMVAAELRFLDDVEAA